MDNMLIRDGTGQSDRKAAALRPGYFRPDEMSLPDLLFLGSSFASQLAYYGADNRPSGDWSALFDNDASALLGSTLADSTRTDHWQQLFASFQERMQAFLMGLAPCPSPETVPVYGLDEKIRDWGKHCGRNAEPTARRVGETIDGLIASYLNHARGALASYLAPHDGRHAAFVPEEPHEGANVARILVPPSVGAPYDEVAHFLSEIFGTYLNALGVIRKIAEEQFALSLSRGEHDPAIGLYLAFAQLFLKAKDSIGDFGQRQLRFYYDRILRFRRQRAQPDNADLVFVPDGTRARTPVRSGMQFIGGEDSDGKELIYATADEILVTDACVAALHTLYFDRDPLHSPEKDLNYATSAWTTSIPTSEAEQYYPLFGTSRSSGKAISEDARLGFAIASPVLIMHEGRRDVVIDLHFEAGAENIEWLIEQLRAIISDATTEGAFYKAFSNAFSIRLTTAKGWSDVPAFVPAYSLVDKDVSADCLRIEFGLPENFPPVVAFDPKLHSGPYETDSAVVSFEIRSDAYLYPYDFLCRQSVRWIDITVKVHGCRDLALCNNNGELSAATAFAPFGPLPRVGSHFIVGSKEAFGKQLTALDLTVDWDGLPANGLEKHYQAYEAGIHAQSFRVALNALSDRAWLPGKTASPIELPMFESENAERSKYDCAELLPYLRPGDVGDGRYGPNARGGFIRLTLASPSQAFGHKEYPQLLARALTRNSRLDALGAVRRIIGRKGFLPIPEAPYTPQISALSIDYVAQARISSHLANATTTRERFYHLHPFGIEAVSLSTHGTTPLVPVVSQRANLYIGIEASEPSGPLSLYFHLRNDSTLSPGTDPPRFEWSCLNGNLWQKLEDFRILSDDTHGFLTSGIVRLDLPNMSRAVHMPGNHYWLRVATDGNASAFCSVYAIHTHGLRVRRIFDETPSAQVNVLPAGSIHASKTALPGIAQILQPANSFAGRQEESLEEMNIRASERLRHRQRAVTPWDYERLVLQRFPSLHKVKCFPNTIFTSEPTKCQRPGSILIVVVPKHADIQDNGEALKENILLLEDIKAYLKGLASPFVEIDVRNPTYERIQVRCAVSFLGAGAEGLLLKNLNRDIRNYISPWNDLGNAANFGWSLRAQEIQGYLQTLPYVQSVKGLSMLRVVESRKDYYELTDTASTARDGAGMPEVIPIYPWSLAIPLRHHLIETYDESDGPWRTGISRLRVGTTFIVSGI